MGQLGKRMRHLDWTGWILGLDRMASHRLRLRLRLRLGLMGGDFA